jgi:hypothetical protein
MTISFRHQYEDFNLLTPGARFPRQIIGPRGWLTLIWALLSAGMMTFGGAYLGTYVASPWWIAAILPVLLVGFVFFSLIPQLWRLRSNAVGSLAMWEKMPTREDELQVSLEPDFLKISSPRSRKFIQWKAVKHIYMTTNAFWCVTATEADCIPKRVFQTSEAIAEFANSLGKYWGKPLEEPH